MSCALIYKERKCAANVFIFLRTTGSILQFDLLTKEVRLQVDMHFPGIVSCHLIYCQRGLLQASLYLTKKEGMFILLIIRPKKRGLFKRVFFFYVWKGSVTDSFICNQERLLTYSLTVYKLSIQSRENVVQLDLLPKESCFPFNFSFTTKRNKKRLLPCNKRKMLSWSDFLAFTKIRKFLTGTVYGREKSSSFER